MSNTLSQPGMGDLDLVAQIVNLRAQSRQSGLRYFRYLFSQSSTVLYHSFEFCGFRIQ